MSKNRNIQIYSTCKIYHRNLDQFVILYQAQTPNLTHKKTFRIFSRYCILFKNKNPTTPDCVEVKKKRSNSS